MHALKLNLIGSLLSQMCQKIELNTWLNHIYCSVHTESDHLSMPIILTHTQSARFPLLTPGLFSAHKSCCYKFRCQLTWRRGADVKHRDFIGTTVTISVKSLYSPGTKLCLGDMKATLEWEHGAGTTGGHSECKWRTYNRHRKQHFFFLFFLNRPVTTIADVPLVHRGWSLKVIHPAEG